jgi:hypothetical protein
MKQKTLWFIGLIWKHLLWLVKAKVLLINKRTGLPGIFSSYILWSHWHFPFFSFCSPKDIESDSRSLCRECSNVIIWLLGDTVTTWEVRWSSKLSFPYKSRSLFHLDTKFQFVLFIKPLSCGSKGSFWFSFYFSAFSKYGFLIGRH